MVGHGEVHHACGALLLGQLQTGAVPVLEHAGLGVLVCGGNELCAHRHSRQVGNSAAVLQSDLCIGDLEFIRRSNELRHQIHIMVGHGEVHHACGALLLGQLQTGAVPVLEHAGLGVLVCGGLELCTHRHSCQIGNSAAILQSDLCTGDIEFIRRSNEHRLQIHIMVGHGEVHHACGALLLGQLQTGAVPVLEHAGLGVLVCGGLELCTHRHSRQVGNSAAVLQSDLCIGDIEFIGLGSVLGVLCFQRDLVCGHREGDGRLGGVHVSGQTGHFPTGEGVTVLLVCGEAELLTCNVLGRLVVHGQGVLRLRHSIGIHFVLGAIVVVTIIHHDVDRVGACFGRLRHRRERAILRDILDGILRSILKIHLAGIVCSLGLGVVLKVGALRLIFAYHLADIKRAVCVLVALLRYDALLVEAVHVRSRRVGFKHLVVVGAHIDEAQFAHAILAAGNGLMFDRPGNGKVALAQGREGQLSGGGHVHHNRLTVILGGQGQGLAICGKLCVRIISADSLAVDIRDRLAEGDRHRSIADKVNRVCCYGIAVDSIHSAVCDHQLALLLTGGEESAFNIAAAHRIGNSNLAVDVRFQTAKDHGILDDRFLRGIARQLDIVEHAAGDLAVLVQLDLSVECAAGDLAISADDILESAACDGAVFIHVDILLEGAVLNDGVLRTNRALCHDAGDSHICKSDLLHGNGLMVGVDGIRRKVHRVAVRGGDVERRACPSVLFHGGVLPAQTLIEVSRHALAAHRHTGHAGQVGQTLFGNAQRLEVACIGGLIHKDLCAVIVAGNAQHLAIGRGVGVVASDRCIVDAQHIGVQGKLCAACAHQIDGIGGKRQSSAVHRSHTAVAHHQCAEPLSCGQQLLDAVRQFAQNRIRNGVGVIAIGIEIAALDHRIGDRARAIAEQGIEGAAGDLDRTVPIDRVDADVGIVIGAAGDLTAGKHQSACLAKISIGNGGIGHLNRAADGCRAQIFEVDFPAALIQDLYNVLISAVVGVAVISPADAHVNTVQLCVRVQAVHIGHAGQVGQTLTGKAQFLVHGQDLNQLHGGIVRKRKRTEAGRERFAVCTDGDRGNCHAAVCKTVVSGACGQSHDTAVGRGYRPRIAAGIAFHHQLQIVPVTGIVILLDDIDFCFLLSVQGAVLRQDQLVCLPLRVGAQAGDIAEKAAPDIAAVLGQLIVGAAVNGALIQLHIGVAAAQNADAVHIASFYQKCTGDSAIQQINRVTISILDGHIAADRAVQNVLGIFTAGTGDGQPGSFVKAPAGTGRCLG